MGVDLSVLSMDEGLDLRNRGLPLNWLECSRQGRQIGRGDGSHSERFLSP